MADEYESKKLRVKCTYDDCSKRFETEKEMRRHKINEPEHNYCKKCDLDCGSWQAFTDHKVEVMMPWLDGRMKGNKDEMPNHIVCEFCGEDFKSFGGRKRHRDQVHKADQNIVCPGCRTKFTRAGNYIEHIETGRCERWNPITGITRKELRDNIQQKHVVKEIMKDPGEFFEKLQIKEAPALPSDMVSESDHERVYEDPGETGEGGVALDLLDQEDEDQKGGHPALEAEIDLMNPKGEQPFKLQQETRSNLETWPRLRSLPPPQLTDSMRNMALNSPAPSTSRTEMSASEFASTITSRRGGVKVYTDSQANSPLPTPSVQEFEDTASDATIPVTDVREHRVVWNTGSTSQMLFKDAPPTPMAGDWPGILKHTQEEQSKDKNLFTSRFWDPTSPEFNSSIFYDHKIFKYSCPFKDCLSSYEHVSDLEGHLRYTHLKPNYRCPLCLKLFKTSHALVSHSEAGGKCRIKDSPMYDRLLDEISGGFLRAEHLKQPKVYPTSSLAAKDGSAADGVMSTKFEAVLPDE